MFYLLYLYLFSQRECEHKTSHSLDIRILISLKILHRVASEILVKFDIFDASISSVKYFRISLNLASEILERTIYLFFIDKIIVLVLSFTSFATDKTRSL